MNRVHQTLIVAFISLIALAGCNNPEQSTTETSPTSNSTPEAVPATTTNPETPATPSATSDFTGLQGVVTNTKTAVEAGDFTKAKGEFDKFEDFWSKVEDGVKAKSPNIYKQIEDTSDEIKAGLKSAAPNKQKLSTALESLNKNVASVAQP